MTFAKEPVHMVPHNINNSIFSINNKISQGVDTVECKPMTPDTEIESANDGMSIFTENPISSANFSVTVLDGSPTCDELWDLRETNASFPIALSDSAAPKLKTKAQHCRFGEIPPVKRDAKPDHVVFAFVSTYSSIRGGSYTIVED